MEIELNTNRLLSVPPRPAASRVQAAPTKQDEAKFSGTEALTGALARLPDTRPGVVQKAREVAGAATYPPDATLNRLAQLFATQLTPPLD